QVVAERSESCGIVEGKIDVRLEADAVKRNAPFFEVGGHGVDGVRLGIDGLRVVVVVEELGVFVGGARPAQRLLDVPGPLSGMADAGQVVPDGLPHGAVFVEGFVDYIPRIDLSGVVTNYGRDVLMQNVGKLFRSELCWRLSARSEPRRHLTVPD